MCLILFAYKFHPEYQLIIASNRDEFYNRPTSPLQLVNNKSLYGIDDKCGGTWLGVSTPLKFSAVTNFRAPEKVFEGALSRGKMVSEFLTNKSSSLEFCRKIVKNKKLYNPFNLLTYDGNNMHWFSNMSEDDYAVKLEPGVYALCNALLDTPWPKVEKAKSVFESCVSTNNIDKENLFKMLHDNTKPEDDELPHTGIGLEWERILSPVFISSEIYGTRTSAIVLIDNAGKIEFTERTWIKKEDGTFDNEDVTEIMIAS